MSQVRTAKDAGSKHALAALSANDRAIISYLQENGRRPFAEIARELKVSERTIRNRVRSLLSSGMIQIAAVTNPAALGYDAAALVGLKLDPAASSRQIGETLATLDNVDYVCVCTGEYPLFIEVFCRDHDQLAHILEAEVARIPGVSAVESFPYLRVHYQQPRFSGTHSSLAGSPGVRAHALDRTDRRIVAALSADGRAPLQSVGDQLGISESQVRARLNAMRDAGSVQILGIVNPMNIGFTTMGWMALKVQPGHRVDDVAEALTQVREVSYVALCTGRVDLFAEVVCHDREDLLRVLDDQVRMIPGIDRFDFSLYIQLHYKRLLPVEPPY